MKLPKKEPLALPVWLIWPPGKIIFPILQQVRLFDQEKLTGF